MTTYYLVLTTSAFLIWGFDKYRAKMGQWRIPERVLLTLVIIGGAFGALAGMLLFRHKTRKIQFWIFVGIACVIHGYILVSQTFFKAV